MLKKQTSFCIDTVIHFCSVRLDKFGIGIRKTRSRPPLSRRRLKRRSQRLWPRIINKVLPLSFSFSRSQRRDDLLYSARRSLEIFQTRKHEKRNVRASGEPIYLKNESSGSSRENLLQTFPAPRKFDSQIIRSFIRNFSVSPLLSVEINWISKTSIVLLE